MGAKAKTVDIQLQTLMHLNSGGQMDQTSSVEQGATPWVEMSSHFVIEEDVFEEVDSTTYYVLPNP